MEFSHCEEISGSLFGCAEGRALLGPGARNGHHGTVARATCCAGRSLRKLRLAVSFRIDLPPKLVNYGSPERHGANASLGSVTRRRIALAESLGARRNFLLRSPPILKKIKLASGQSYLNRRR